MKATKNHPRLPLWRRILGYYLPIPVDQKAVLPFDTKLLYDNIEKYMVRVASPALMVVVVGSYIEFMSDAPTGFYWSLIAFSAPFALALGVYSAIYTNKRQGGA